MGNVNAFQAISTSSNKADRLLTWLIETVVSSPSTAFSHCSMYLDNSGSLKIMEGKSKENVDKVEKILKGSLDHSALMSVELIVFCHV